MTADQQRQFEHLWPALSVRLYRLLARKKVSPWLAEDLVQETGLRLIRMWPDIDQAKPLWPLTATIALNLFRDELRRAGSKESLQALPDSPSSENVEERGMARVELRAVGGALAQMPAPQRDAILADISSAPNAPLASSARMMRMRARRRLQHLMDHASVLGVALGVQMRRAMKELELLIGRVIPSDGERVTAAAISLLAAFSVGVALAPEGPRRLDEHYIAPGGSLDATDTPTTDFGPTGSSAMIAGSVGSYRASGNDVRSRGEGSWKARRERAVADNANSTNSQEGPEHFPGPIQYAVEVTEHTYLRGEVEADVTGVDDVREGELPPLSPGSFNCTVAPTHTAASCSAGENGSESRRVRAQHRGEARVAGHKLY